MRPVEVTAEVALPPGGVWDWTGYDVFDRPRRAVNHAVDTPLRGDFVATHEPTRVGTRITWRWDVRATNPLLNVPLRALRPFLTRSLQGNLDEYVKAAARTGT